MKRFYNNTKMSGVFSKTLRMIALLCVLMGFSGSAWGATTIYFENTLNWSNVYVCVGASWDNTNNWVSTSGKNAYQMTKVATNEFGNDIFGYTYDENVTETKIVFIADNQGNYNQLNGTRACYRGDFDSSKPLFKPNTTIESSSNNTDYYNNGDWYSAPCFPTKTIYFVNNLGWKSVYAYLYSGEYWSDDKGTGSQSGGTFKDGPIAMTKVSGTADIYTCAYNSGHSGVIAFSEDSQAGYENFAKNKVVYRGDLCSPNDMFIPNASQTPQDKNTNSGSTSKYYNEGTWSKFEQNTYSLAGSFNSWSTTANQATTVKGYNCSIELDLTAGTYEFKLVKNGDNWFGNGAKIATQTDGAIEIDGNSSNCTLNAGFDGIYTFTFGEDWIDGKSGMYLKVEYGQAKEPVLLAHKAEYIGTTDVKLSAYIQYTYCGDAIDDIGGKITEWGFVICPGSATSACTPTKNSLQKYPAERDAIYRGEIFDHTLNLTTDNLIGGAMYGYRGYVTIGGKMYLTKETGTFFFPGDCTQQEIDENKTPIIYTIDASLGEDYADDCNLRYGSLQVALNRLRDLSKDENVDTKYKYATYDATNKSVNLNVPIEFHVSYYDDTPDDASKAYCYEGDTKAGVSGGGTSSENSMALIIKDINRNLGDEDERYTLTIKGASEKARPWLHHVIVRNSKDVILDNLAIFSDPTNSLQDDALEFDCNSKEWHALTVGKIEKANIVVKNCMIGSNGFTGVHASAYDGITFENNEFEAIMATTGDLGNAVSWGASAKFIACENIKFIRNNFRGAHATLVWFQDSKNALFMNNVFWNTNQYEANCSAIRLVNQFDKTVEKVGFYYNTFYWAEDGGDSAHKYDFLHYSSIGTSYFENIEFKYNNCYSYDESVPGKDQNPESKNVSGGVYCPNNFWSKYDDKNNKTKSVFAFGSCDDANIMVNVSDIVCVTTASGPASLVIKGGTDKSENSLNVGVKPTIEEIQGATGQIVSDEDLTYDRYNKDARPAENGWTYGAYQAKEDITVKTIYWVGVDEKWDNRNNWGYYESDIVKDNSLNANNNAGSLTRSAELQRLSCINNLHNDLKAVIPEHPLVQIEGGRKLPEIPTTFNSTDRESKYGIPASEQVSTPNGEFAHTIEIEYGAALKGVTDLVNGERHYTEAKTYFEAPRSKWVLVGTVVKPFDAEAEGGIRNLYSKDFYKDREPQVYMHEATMDEYNNVLWGNPFPYMDREIKPNEVFAINIPDEYGEYKIPSYYYYQYEKVDENKLNHSEVPIDYNYTGHFLRESAHMSVDITEGTNQLLSNSYPCNLSAEAIENLGCNVSYYNYDAGTFMPLGASDVEIKPQHGFMIAPTKTGTITFTDGLYADGNTRSRSANATMPAFELNLYNATKADGGYSMVVVRYDEFKGESNEPVSSDTKKIFSANAYAPDLYMIMYDGQYSRLHLGKTSQEIPLGIRIKNPMSIRFEQISETDFTVVKLLDKLTGKEYNLLGRSYTTELLEVGDLEGRFYLQVSTDDLFPDEEEENGDVSTSIDESTEAKIQIYADANQGNAIKVITNNVELETIYISDMVGHVYTYKVSGNSAFIELPVPAGVYVVSVIGDTASRTEKVILK